MIDCWFFFEGNGTRMDVERNTTISIVLTLVNAHLTKSSEWKVLNISTVGSDHFPFSEKG